MSMHFSAAATLILLVSLSCPLRGAGSTPLPALPVLKWTDNTGTLEFGAAEVSFSNGGLLTTRAYRDGGAEPRAITSIPGPTIRMKPGVNYTLTLRNTLNDSGPVSVEKMNSFRDPNITNLHTHGLHVPGTGNADNVMRAVRGGDCATYVYVVPRDHMGGTLWYHPHHHGSTYLQLGGGAVGVLVVEDDEKYTPSTVLNMEEQVMLIQRVAPGEVQGVGGDTLVSFSDLPPSFYLVNGARYETDNTVLEVPVNTWQRWRIALADSSAEVRMVSFAGENGAECEVLLLARDGIWRRNVPRSLVASSISLTGASRVDVAFRCDWSRDEVVSHIIVGDTTVLDIAVNTSLATCSSDECSPFDDSGNSWTPPFPHYIPTDLLSRPVDGKQSVEMGKDTINNKQFDPLVPTDVVQSGTVNELLLKKTANHPFHLHMFPMMVADDECGNDFERGEYYDTFSGDTCSVRYISATYGGDAILHCHILEHEDIGSMGFLKLDGGLVNDGDPLSYAC